MQEESLDNDSRREEIKSRIFSLSKLIDSHNVNYHSFDSPTISDQEYDSLMNELIYLESLYPEFISYNSPTQRVGARPLSSFKQINHNVPMLSLANAFKEEDVVSFDRRIKKILTDNNLLDSSISYFCDLKIDGLAVNLRYENSVLVSASTRGDGYVGEDVTSNIVTIKSIPLFLHSNDVPEILEIRGEIFMSHNDFKRLNERQKQNGSKTFMNPRNAAAGSLRNLDPKIAAERNLKFFAYGIGEIDRGYNLLKHSLVMDWISSLGFPVNRSHQKIVHDYSSMILYYNEVKKLRVSLSYDIDGVVYKVDSLNFQRAIGYSVRAPKFALAHKFSPEESITRLVNIEVQVGRTGAVTPVARLESVFIGGVNITSATLHNENEIRRKDLRIGDFVRVRRAGDVIPEVVSFVPELRPDNTKIFSMATNCPICHASLHRVYGESVVRCTGGLYCSAQLKQRLLHAASRKALNIVGLGESLICKLVDSNKVTSLADIYRLTVESLLELDNMGEKSANNIVDSINNSRYPSLDKFLFSLGILHVGEATANAIARRFVDLEKVIACTEEDLLNIHDVGPRIASSVVIFFSEQKNIDLLRKIIDSGVIVRNFDFKKEQNGLLKNKKFVITGKLKKFSREEIKQYILYHGGKVSSTISSNTDYLIVGEDPGNKLFKAKDNEKIVIINEDQLLELVKV